ncbi:MAG: methyltransferase domain-containing protein [Solirubrobacteraceae bacterium]
MPEVIAERPRRYTLDGGDADLRRLVRISELSADSLRAALHRVQIREGWKAIECGCGPIGGLAVLAEMVGPSGHVVGVDFNESAIQRARSVIATLALDNVEVVAGEVNELDPSVLGGPFDLAYTRCFLMHQSDMAKTLARIADVVRPGGWIVCQEPLRAPAPRSHPPLEALSDYWELLHALLGGAGVRQDSVESLRRVAADCALEEHGATGFFSVMSPADGFDIHAGTLTAIRERATRTGIATAERIDELLAALRTAKPEKYQWVSTPFFLDVALRKPSQGKN